MFFDAPGQSCLPHKSGTIEFSAEYHTRRKPAWLVLLKILGSLAMIAVGAVIAIPSLVELEYPLWQAIAITVGGMAVYTGLAFFVRPDPFQASESVNKWLFRFYCCLGPGRFTAETFLDVCVLVGLSKGAEVAEEEVEARGFGSVRAAPIGSFDATQPIPPLDPSRFAQSSGNFVAGQIQLDTQRFLSTASSSLSQPAKA
jgi:hypothetical protein